MYFCRSAGQLLVLKHSVLNFTHILLILTSEVKQQVTCVTFICIHVVIPLETYCATQKIKDCPVLYCPKIGQRIRIGIQVFLRMQHEILP